MSHFKSFHSIKKNLSKLFRVVPAAPDLIEQSNDENDEGEQQKKFDEIADVMGLSRKGSGEAVAKVWGLNRFIYPLHFVISSYLA